MTTYGNNLRAIKFHLKNGFKKAAYLPLINGPCDKGDVVLYKDLNKAFTKTRTLKKPSRTNKKQERMIKNEKTGSA